MYLGIDLGTSSVKILLIDDGQKIIGSAERSLTVDYPQAGWSEQDPQTWIDATGEAMDALCAQWSAATAAIEGIGLSGQMHGAVALGGDHRPLRPAILWNDTRSHAEAAVMDDDKQFRAISGNIVFPGFTAPKIAWMKNHEGALFSQIAKILLPKDYLRLWLTGEFCSDPSDASGTAWLDVAERAWSEPLLEATSLSLDHMPDLVEGTAPSGQLRADLAKRWGIVSSVTVAGGGGDNAVSACGLGVIEPGAAFVSLGTSGVVFAATADFQPNPESAVHAFCHCLPQTWHQMGVILSAAGALDWLSGLLDRAPSDLIGELEDEMQGPGSVTFLPYLSGERTPHNDAAIRGAFDGLSMASDRAALTRAVLEGVGFALRDNLAALSEAGTQVDRLLAVGGGSRSRVWLQLLATILDVAIDLPRDGEFGAAFGAARLGLIAATGAEPKAVLTSPPVAVTIEPDRGQRRAYDTAYHNWKRLYPALKKIRI